MKLIANSRGLISTFVFIKDYNILFDAGEGAASLLFHQLGSIKFLCITHDHWDHIAGIIQLLNLRERVSNKSKLKIFAKFTPRIKNLISFFNWNNLEFIEIQDNETYELDKGRRLHTFKTDHAYSSFGFIVQEVRGIRKKEYQNLSKEECQKLATSGIRISENFTHNLLTFIGDTPKVSEEIIQKIKETDFLFIESTYLTEEELIGEGTTETHSCLDYSLELKNQIKVKELFLLHFSSRYSTGEILQVIATKKLENTHFIIKDLIY